MGIDLIFMRMNRYLEVFEKYNLRTYGEMRRQVGCGITGEATMENSCVHL